MGVDEREIDWIGVGVHFRRGRAGETELSELRAAVGECVLEAKKIEDVTDEGTR
jgi:hypothetical protein